jgi:hypothetical protein
LPDDLSTGSANIVRLRPVSRTGKNNQAAKSDRLERAVEIYRSYNQIQKLFSAPLGRVDLDELADRADFALARQPNQVGKNNLEITDRLRTIPLGVFQQFLCKTIHKG